jgi:hypothetical protein
MQRIAPRHCICCFCCRTVPRAGFAAARYDIAVGDELYLVLVFVFLVETCFFVLLSFFLLLPNVQTV